MSLIFSMWIKFFFLFAPFFVVSMFLSLTKGSSATVRARTANRAVFSAFCAAIILFFFGAPIFEILGITLDSFRVGTGILLFLSAVSLVSDGVKKNADMPEDKAAEDNDPAVVPLAIPIIIGPATIGAILVYGAGLEGTEIFYGLAGMSLALFCLWLLLRAASYLEKALGANGLNIMSKITGLILAAMAAQITMSGLKSFFQIAT